jgi:asparagine synthase (glutamine-hydrolysing)
MCSINGFNFGNETLIKKMVDVTKHRGPDDEGFYVDENVSFGHARLSIIDLSENARQPIWNEDRSMCIVFNGEIYNFKELKKDLEKRGHKFKSNSDTEVILHLYEDKKEKCLNLLNGIFAFAIYSKKENYIFLARDRVGVKPLYYYFKNGKFIFSSEIKGILQHPIDKNINREALNHHLKMFFTPSPFTLIDKISKLSPAHYLVLKQNKLEIKKYWDIEDLPEVKSKEEAIRGIKELFDDSVKRQLLSSDRPVGIFLSGGIDSTSILGSASNVSKGKIKTYSTGFDIEPEKFNQDLILAKKTSEYFKTDHHELIVTGKDARDNLEKVIWHMEEPVPNPIQISTFLLSQQTKNDVAVVLGGDGGDEIFGGYPRYYFSRIIDKYQCFPEFLRKSSLINQFIETALRKKDLLKKLNTPNGVSRYFLHMSQKERLLSRVLNPNFKIEERSSLNFFKENYPENKFKDNSKYLMYLDLMTWLSDESLLRSDKMTMAFGLEERVPILDHRLVEFAFKIPTKYKIKGRKSWKWIFKESVKEYLPSHILNQQKRGWFSPAAKWLRSDLKDFAFDVLSPDYCKDTKEYFNFLEMRKILENHISKKEYNLDIIWSVLTFQIWYKEFIEAK